MDEGDGCPPATCAQEAGGCPDLGVLLRDARTPYVVLCLPPRAAQRGTAELRSVQAFWPHCGCWCQSCLPCSLRPDGQVILN